MKKIVSLFFIFAFVFPQLSLGESDTENALKEAALFQQRAAESQKAGKYEEAISYAKKALEIRENISGKSHPDTGLSLIQLSVLYKVTGRYAEAEHLIKRTLGILEQIFGKEDTTVAGVLEMLADTYRLTARYTEAETLHRRALSIREKAFGKVHPDVAASLYAMAMLYRDAKRYSEAEQLHKMALEIREKTLGKEHLEVAQSLHSLAMIYQNAGKYSEAEPLLKRALGVKIKALGGEHPEVASSLHALATLYQITGRYSDAEPMHKTALEIREKVLGKEHPNVSASLNNLAETYKDTGRYEEAGLLLKRALEIRIKKLGREHIDVAVILHNLADIFIKTGGYAEAEPLSKKTLDIFEKTYGKEHPNVSASLNNLALIYKETGKYSEAEPLLKRALGIIEKALGKEHPDVATSLHNMAGLYSATNRQAEAELLYKRALDIEEKTLGKDHPSVSNTLYFLAAMYGSANKHTESHKLFKRAISIENKTRENIFLLLSEKQKLNYVEQNAVGIELFLSHTSLHMRSDPQAVTSAFNAWIKWKGAVMEAQRSYLDALMHSQNPQIGKKFNELTNIRREMARLQFSKPEKTEIDNYKKNLETLEKKKETLEVELSRLSREFGLQQSAAIWLISETLPIGSIYLDFAKISMYDFNQKKWGKLRYLLFVLIPDINPVVRFIDIADAEDVDRHINAYLSEMNKVKRGKGLPDLTILNKEAKALYELVMKPVEPYLNYIYTKGKRHLFISPDGNLNLIPFEALVTPDGKYLMEKFLVNYIPAGRDLMRFGFTYGTKLKGEALIIADPDYDMGLNEKERLMKEMDISEERIRSSVSRNAVGMSFERLPETKQEADAIESILKNKLKLRVKNYQNKKALEDLLFKTESPEILHLATHGYFLKDEEVKSSGLRGVNIKLKDDYAPDDSVNIENPMLRSGVVLAGVNSSLKEGRDDGMVSAEKILGLKLKGTELVVLSACETGIGDVQSGEGVFGLKRAFILSGAKTMVMSLWSVPSAETTELMIDFYTLISEGKTKAEALREAKLKMMKKKANPFYWGAFIMVGKHE